MDDFLEWRLERQTTEVFSHHVLLGLGHCDLFPPPDLQHSQLQFEHAQLQHQFHMADSDTMVAAPELSFWLGSSSRRLLGLVPLYPTRSRDCSGCLVM